MRQVKDAAVSQRQENGEVPPARRNQSPPSKVAPPGMAWFRGSLVKLK